MKIKITELENLAQKALLKYGYSQEEANIIKKVLMFAQLRGNNQGVVKLIGSGIPKREGGNKPKIVVSKTLKEYEEILTPCGFFRVHISHLINLQYVEYFHAGLEEYVILKNGENIEVSRRRKAEFLQKLSSL
jgi:hypothetical protein